MKILLFLLPLFTWTFAKPPYQAEDFCVGNSLNIPAGADTTQLESYKRQFKARSEKFQNCKVVIGNLIIAFEFNPENYKTIEEITGYLKFYDIPGETDETLPTTDIPATTPRGSRHKRAAADSTNSIISLNALMLIRGDELDRYEGALVFNNVQSTYAQFENLHMIRKGKIVFTDSPKLCYWDPTDPKDGKGVRYSQFVDWDSTTPFTEKFAVKDTKFPESFSHCKDNDYECGSAGDGGCMARDSAQNPYLVPQYFSQSSDDQCPRECESSRCFKEDDHGVCHTCPGENYFFNKEMKCLESCFDDKEYAYGQYCVDISGSSTITDDCKDGFKKETVSIGDNRFVKKCLPE